MSQSIPLVETVGLKKYFNTPAGQLHAVDDVNVKVFEGQTLGVVGESGCGKSTLGRTILRLLEPTAGDVLYEGKSIVGLNKSKMRQMRQKMQIIFQDPYSSIDARMTVLEIIAEYMIVNKKFRTRQECYNQAAKLMDVVGLARRLANSYPHELDGGRRQRIGIARALSLNPKFIVCDEPVSALDVSIQAQVLNLMKDIQEKMGLTYLFIAHDLSVVQYMSNRIAVMYLGKVVEIADNRSLYDNPLHPYTKALLSAIPVPDIHTKKKRQILGGEVPSPIHKPSGCAFHNRCPHCMEICKKQEPQLQSYGEDGHMVACFLHNKEQI